MQAIIAYPLRRGDMVFEIYPSDIAVRTDMPPNVNLYISRGPVIIIGICLLSGVKINILYIISGTVFYQCNGIFLVEASRCRRHDD